MKLIPLHDGGKFKPREVIQTVVSQPEPNKGINADDMRKRCRLLDALDKADGETLLLEDADHALLSRLISGFQFGSAHPQLLAIIDSVLNAKAPVLTAEANAEAPSADEATSSVSSVAA